MKKKTEKGDLYSFWGNLQGVSVTFLNVYAPPGSEWKFYKQNVESLFVGETLMSDLTQY